MVIGTNLASEEKVSNLRYPVMLTCYRQRNKDLLSRRARILICVHHLVITLVVSWIGYLFYVRELT